jgi:dTDP-glucose 4,6-dehydratase
MGFDWKERVVAVTGAGGFIGSHLTERLLAEGAQVRAMVHGEKIGHLLGLDHDHLEIWGGGDLSEADFVDDLVQDADTVFHLGAVTSVAWSHGNPEETIRTNVVGTLNVCEACRMARVRRLVHTSTAGVYGNAENDAPITEDHPVVACSPYTAGKLGGDFTAQTYYRSYDLPVVTVRLFNVFGPRMGRYLIMPAIIEQLLAGPTLKLGDLTPTRTFTYIEDIVNGYLLAAAAPDVEGELFHFGAEEVITMGELVDRVAGLMGVTYELEQDESRMRPAKSEIHRVRVDSSKARGQLGWDWEVGLDAGLERTIAWIRDTGYAV